MSIIELKKIRTNTETISYRILQSPRNTAFEFKTGYFTIFSDQCPEFFEEILYVWGENTAEDSTTIQVPISFHDKFICGIAEYNRKQGLNVPLTGLIECCGHLWIDANDCICKRRTCYICGCLTYDFNVYTFAGQEFAVCKKHTADRHCRICNTNHQLIMPRTDLNIDESIEACPSCFLKELRVGRQHGYSYRPDPLLYHDFDVVKGKIVVHKESHIINTPTKKKFFIGSEVEQQLNKEKFKPIMLGDLYAENKKDFIFCKHDGSIGFGTEVVTQPFSWEFFKHYNWNHIISKDVHNYRGSSSLIGHHVHINKDAFTRTHLYQFLKFHHCNIQWVTFISQRAMGNYCKVTGGAFTKATHKKGREKYEFINITNHTVEWRAFTSPLTVGEYKKNIEYIHAVFTWSKQPIKIELTVLDFYSWVEDHKKDYPHLWDFIETKKANHFISNSEYVYTPHSGLPPVPTEIQMKYHSVDLNNPDAVEELLEAIDKTEINTRDNNPLEDEDDEEDDYYEDDDDDF